jgi:hypothetical protein
LDALKVLESAGVGIFFKENPFVREEVRESDRIEGLGLPLWSTDETIFSSRGGMDNGFRTEATAEGAEIQ